jgi:hypothetical protein
MEPKPGNETSEYVVAKGAGVWGVVAMILGFITASGAEILAAVGVTESSNLGVIAGAIIAVAGIALKALTSLGYIKSRTDVKMIAEALEEE